MLNTRPWIGTAVGASLAVTLLSGCGGGSGTAADAPSSASSSPTTKASDTAKESPSSDDLTAFASEVEKQTTALMGTFNGMYEDIRVEPVPPDGVRYVYVFAKAVPDGAGSSLEAQVPVLRATFNTDVAPALEGIGIDHPSVTFEFRNPDESVIWTKTFTK